MNQRTLWIIGGTSGIGEAFDYRARSSRLWSYVRATGEAEVDVRDDFAIAEELGRQIYTDIVYCAGVNELRWLPHVDQAHYLKMQLVNAWGFLNVCRIAHYMARLNIVAITSDAAVRPMRTSHAYCASKAALNSLIKTVAREKAPDWRVNGIAPGIIDGTEMTEYIDKTVPALREWEPEQASAYELSQIPAQRRGSVGEVALLIEQVLLGPQYMTGEIITLNGGR